MSASGKIALSGLPRGELEALVERLLAENAALRGVVAELRAEVATLKGVKRRPEVKPSGMEKGTEPATAGTGRSRGTKGLMRTACSTRRAKPWLIRLAVGRLKRNAYSSREAGGGFSPTAPWWGPSSPGPA